MKLVEFTMEGLPPTLNHQYEHTRFSTRLVPEVKIYRANIITLLMRSPMIGNVLKSLPPQPLAFEADFESPIWFTKERMIRRKDIDNMNKSLLDAIDEFVWPKTGTRGLKRPSVGFRDEWVFKLTPEKVLAARDRTLVRIYSHVPRNSSVFQREA